MKLKPLEQWICDACHEVVDLPMARLEMLSASDRDDASNYGFRSVHRTRECQLNHQAMFQQGHMVGSIDIEDGLNGPDGLVHLLAILTPGKERDPNGRWGTRDVDGWCEIVRRIHTPHYEEARQYWDEAERDGFFYGANEYWPYTQNALLEIIKRYKPVTV